MSTITSPFWQAVDDEVAALVTVQPTTAAQVVAILRVYDPADADARGADAVFSAEGREISLHELLAGAGWFAEPLGEDCHLLHNVETGSRLGLYGDLVYAEPETHTRTA